MRGATDTDKRELGAMSISIHAPHARSDHVAVEGSRADDISIHAPHARSDAVAVRFAGVSTAFQSTLLMRGATVFLVILGDAHDGISIHAPHARSDQQHAHDG